MAFVFSTKLVYLALGLFVGLYTGIHLSGLHHYLNHESSNTSGQKDEQSLLFKAQTQLEEAQRKLREKENAYAKLLHQVEIYEDSIENLQGGAEGGPGAGAGADCDENNKQDVPEKENNPLLMNPHPVCQEWLKTTTHHHHDVIPSAMSLWNAHLQKVLQATKLTYNDPSFRFHDVTAELLQIMTPRLPLSVKSIPHNWASVEHALTVLYERYQYLALSEEERVGQEEKRPLKILIMGGSLLVGTNCRKLMTEFQLGLGLPKRDCTWSNRLQSFLNQFVVNILFPHSHQHDPKKPPKLPLEETLVQVTKVAMGGTNTATGNVIFQYDLIPPEARNPDIVFNAYATNDMHILTILEAQSANTTLRDKVFDMTQDFVRHVLDPGCYNPHKHGPSGSSTSSIKPPPPLLIHVDDYLGNEQRKIWDTTELSQGVQVLANYYGFTSISYADAVRNIVYGDTHESWFSAHWWETGTFEREIHPGMPMHIASTWVSVYALLHLTTTYCSIPPAPFNYQVQDYQEGYLGLPPLNKDVPTAKGKPHSPPEFSLPPRLTKELLIEDVTRLWKDADQKQQASCRAEQQSPQHATTTTKCPFSWVSGLSLQQNNETWIQEYFQRHATTWEGWELGKDGGKLGFVPMARTSLRPRSANMVLEFSFAAQPIRSVTLFFMKSYGPKWANSRVQVKTFSNGATLLEERILEGFHDKNTSEMYTEALELDQPIASGSTLQVGATLVGGSTFKLMGLAICS